jgi:hypothetical protein
LRTGCPSEVDKCYGDISPIDLSQLQDRLATRPYRSWLDAVGTAITVQQKLMRHSDIQTTLNIYGEIVTDEMKQAGSKIAGLALKTDSKLIPGAVSH